MKQMQPVVRRLCERFVPWWQDFKTEDKVEDKVEGKVNRREEAIFEAALALPPEQRPAYLSQACGDGTELRRRIEILLQSNDRAGEFLEPALAGGADKTMVVPAPPSEQP